MTYIEKVLKGLECCAKCERCAGNCPYDDDDDNCEKCTSELAKGSLSVIREQQAEIKALREEKEKTESNFAIYVDEKREEIEEINAKMDLLIFELKKCEELVSVLKNKA